MTSSGVGRVVESSTGSPAISVVVTTIPTSTSQTPYVDPLGSNTPQNPISQIKLVGVGGLERQNYCCGHWFPSSKSYHRHLAEKAFSDTSHEAKLLELGMVRCTHCSIWVHSQNIVAHLAKSHSNNTQGKTSKVIPVGTIAGMSGLGRESLMSGTNIIIKVAGQNPTRSFSSNTSKTSASPLSTAGTVKLVSPSSNTLYQKLQNISHSSASGGGKVIVRKSPVVNVGPRLMVKQVKEGGVVHLARNHKMMQQVAQSNLSSVNRVPLSTALKVSKQSPSVSPAGSKEIPPKTVVSKSSLQKISGKNVKSVKGGTPEVPKDKSVNKNSHNSKLSENTKSKEKTKVSAGEASSRKIPQSKKQRKQVLKPSAGDASFTDTVTPLPSDSTAEKIKSRKKSKSVSRDESSYPNPPPNHKGQRRKSKESLDTYTPKMSKRPGRGVRGVLNKHKRGPGRPRKNQHDETPNTSETDSLFGETDKEDLENEPVVMAKNEEENIPTVELDLFTLPSTNEHVSVLLTEPKNPNFKVYASMDAIFVGDSALGDVTNQIGYVTDANNVVYVNPSHFLFPNVEDLENFVPSPILTMKGNKTGHAPARKTWGLNGNKAHPPVILKHATVAGSKDSVSSDTNLEEKESQVPISPAKSRIEDHVLKTTQSSNTILVKQEKKSPKQKPKPKIKPVQVSNSLEPEAKEVTKDFQNSAVEEVDILANVSKKKSAVEAVDTLTSMSKKKSHKKKKRHKSAPEEAVQSNNETILEKSLLQRSSISETSPLQVPLNSAADIKTRDSGDTVYKRYPAVIDSIIQKCVVQLEELKYPTKFEKSASLPPELLCGNEKVKTSGDAALESLSPIKTVEDGVPQEEAPVDSSDLKPVNEDVTSVGPAEENWKPPLSVETSHTSPANDIVAKTVESKSLETVQKTTETYPNSRVTEDTRVVCRTMGGGGFPKRMRRRRLRTKSANIVSSLTDPKQEISGGQDRRVRHVSENSSLNKTKVMEQNGVLVSSQNERTGSGHSPKRKCEKVTVSGDADNLIDNSLPKQPSPPQASTELSSTGPKHPLSDRKVLVLPSSTGNGVKKHKSKHEGSKVRVLSFKAGKGVKKHKSKHEGSKVTVLSSKAGKGVKKHKSKHEYSKVTVLSSKAGKGLKKDKSKHEGKQKTMKVEPVCSEVLESVDVSGGVDSELPSEKLHHDSVTLPAGAEKGVKKHKSKHEGKPKTVKVEPVCNEIKPVDVEVLVSKQSSEEMPHEETPVQVRSVRERRPSFKLLESISVGSQSPKRLPLPKVEQPLSPPKHSTDKLGSPQPSENDSIPSVVTDLSPSREWHGRGAKLKAQVLIQDQQAGVIDSQIYPPNYSPKSTTEPLSPNKLVLHSPPKTPHTLSKSSSPSNSKPFKSPTIVQNREWQARGAKLKAQVMISDPESSLVPYVDPVASPPAKRPKLESSPTHRDTGFSPKSPVTQITSKPLSVSPLSPRSPHGTKTIKQEKNQGDIRTYLKTVSPITQVKKEKEESEKENEGISFTPKLSIETTQECSSIKEEQIVQPVPIPECTFEGFKRLTRQSALRSKTLLRLISLFGIKRWHRLDKFPFPVDQLCDWNDELLTALTDPQ